MQGKPRRRWFQFSLAGFLFLLTVLGISLGAYVDRAHRQRDAAQVLRDTGAMVHYDYPRFNPYQSRQQRSAWRDWVIERLGPDYAARVQHVQLAVEPKTSGGSAPIGNERLRLLSQFTDLENLFLPGVDVSDDGLSHLRQLRKLTLLNLDFTNIGDEGLSHLSELNNLESLNLNGTRISDAGLIHLQKLTKLRHVSARQTRVTKQGAQQLQAKLPGCRVGI